ARQILEAADQPRLLFLLRDAGQHFRKRPAAVDDRGRRADVKLVALDRRLLRQPDAERSDIVAAPIRDIAVDRHGAVALMTAEFGETLRIQQFVRPKALDAL